MTRLNYLSAAANTSKIQNGVRKRKNLNSSLSKGVFKDGVNNYCKIIGIDQLVILKCSQVSELGTTKKKTS